MRRSQLSLQDTEGAIGHRRAAAGPRRPLTSGRRRRRRAGAALAAAMLLLVVAVPASSSGEAPPFIGLEVRSALFDLLVSEIERLDADAIRLRERHKKTSWEEFKALSEPAFAYARSWAELEEAVDAFSAGFTNGHSSIRLADGVRASRGAAPTAEPLPGPYLGYEARSGQFFAVTTGQTVEALNGEAMADRFARFVDLECPFAADTVCARALAERLFAGTLEAGGRTVSKVTVRADEGPEELPAERLLGSGPRPYSELVGESCESIGARYAGWRLRFSGRQMCLFERDRTALLKIKYFGPWGTDAADFRCQRPKLEPGSMCREARAVSALLADAEVADLIVDLQNNPGGTESTAVLAALSPRPFRDLAVRYRNTVELRDPGLRAFLFYRSEKAEAWYRELEASGRLPDVRESRFLPARGDFCRGPLGCRLGAIEPSAAAVSVERLSVVVNGRCVSSCDDLALRLRRYAGARIYGEPPVGDTTYARIRGTLYLTDRGSVAARTAGEGQAIELPDSSQELIVFRLPYTRTVDDEGLPLEASPLDGRLFVGREDFERGDAAFVDELDERLRAENPR